jgi:chemotaxis protein MotB
MSHGGESGRWLVSYSDFITLLMVLFVILYSMGQTDIKKYKAMAESFRSAFSGAPMRVVDPQIDQAGGLPKEAQAAPISVEGLPMTSAVGAEVASQLSDLLANANMSSEVSIQNNVDGILISLSEKLLFKQGTAEMVDEAYPILDTIVEMLKPIGNDVKIVGHTDDTPPTDPRYKDNWELSTGRAMTIVNYFVSKGIEPKRLIAVGRGEFQPIFVNDTPEHRALNSRADIIIVYQMDSDVINVDVGSGASPAAQP